MESVARTVLLFCAGIALVSAVVVGPPSANTDDATSTATCPPGQLVYKCDCLRPIGSETQTCEGGKISAEGRSCTVYNQLKKPGTQAVATCAQPVKVMRSGDQWQADPIVQCEAGYTVYSCLYHTKWQQSYRTASHRRAGNGCQAVNCPRCRISAVCHWHGFGV